ncbi:hypothetical protein AKJ16_DCAP21697 [Drosera capensis]
MLRPLFEDPTPLRRRGDEASDGSKGHRHPEFSPIMSQLLRSHLKYWVVMTTLLLSGYAACLIIRRGHCYSEHESCSPESLEVPFFLPLYFSPGFWQWMNIHPRSVVSMIKSGAVAATSSA